MKNLAITHDDALCLMDSLRVSDPRTTALRLRIAQLVLAFENEPPLVPSHQDHPVSGAGTQRCHPCGGA
jgi:hypothetical protein